MKPALFISYAHTDESFASALSARLRKHAKVWIDREMHPGDHISEATRRKISVCDRFVLCASRNSLQSSWVNEELLVCLKREKVERRSILVVVAIDDFLANEWRSALASYLNDRLLVDCRGVPVDSESFHDKVNDLHKAVLRVARYSPLLHGTWGYIVRNIAKERLLVGAFRLEGSDESLYISKGLTFKVSKEGARTPWLVWESKLVAYDGHRLAFFYDGVLQANHPEYARDVCAAWLLNEEADMLGFNGLEIGRAHV